MAAAYVVGMGVRAFAMALVAGGAIAACGGGDDGASAGNEAPAPDTPKFTTRIDNPYWPMAPGTRWTYREDGENGRTQRVTVTVTHRIKTVASGVRARVVHDVVTRGGKLIENTWDWYAQDRAGNVWYLGEDTTEYEKGNAATREGSWEAGVDGARAGIIMPAHPRVGMRYRQEHYAGKAEDRAAIVKLDGRATVPAGRYTGVLVTRDWNPLKPGAFEHKYYARGVGPVLSVSRGGSREELVRVHVPGG
jgi:hypothetical protein